MSEEPSHTEKAGNDTDLADEKKESVKEKEQNADSNSPELNIQSHGNIMSELLTLLRNHPEIVHTMSVISLQDAMTLYQNVISAQDALLQGIKSQSLDSKDLYALESKVAATKAQIEQLKKEHELLLEQECKIPISIFEKPTETTKCPQCTHGILVMQEKKEIYCDVHHCHRGTGYRYVCSHCHQPFSYDNIWLNC